MEDLKDVSEMLGIFFRGTLENQIGEHLKTLCHDSMFPVLNSVVSTNLIYKAIKFVFNITPLRPLPGFKT